MLGSQQHKAALALANVERVVKHSLAGTREIIRRYEAARHDIRRTLRRGRQLRRETATLRAALERLTPDGTAGHAYPRRPESD